MVKFEKIPINNLSEDNLGLLLWQLEELENFYPVYKTMVKRE